MADAVEGSPPAKAKAAAAAADQSSPSSDARAVTVRVPGGGSLTVSKETPSYAKDDKGRNVHVPSKPG